MPYKNKEDQKAWGKRYRETEAGKISRRKAKRKYNSSEKGKACDQKYYENNKKRISKKQNLEREKIKQFIQEYKLSKGCSICGYNKCAGALVFHHNGDKKFEIGRAISERMGIEKIKEEMEKCVILCANCHRELHDKNTA